jgi:hypothetical protein
METFFWSLLMAMITAITYIAYKHPRSFVKVANLMLLLVFCGIVTVTTYSLATLQNAVSLLVEEVAMLKGQNSLLELAASNIESVYNLQLVTWIIAAAVVAYLSLLTHLPKLLDLDEKKVDQNRES